MQKVMSCSLVEEMLSYYKYLSMEYENAARFVSGCGPRGSISVDRVTSMQKVMSSCQIEDFLSYYKCLSVDCLSMSGNCLRTNGGQ